MVSLLELPTEIFDIIIDYTQLEKATAAGGTFHTKKNIFQLIHTSKSLRKYLIPKWDTLTIRINGLKCLGYSSYLKEQCLFDRAFNFCVTNENVAKFVREMIKNQSLSEFIKNIKFISVYEATPYTWGNCSSTIALTPGICDFVNVKQSHLFSWLLTMGLKSSEMELLQSITIQRVDGEGFKEREPLAKIFGDCSALEIFANEFTNVRQEICFNTSTAFQIADVELSKRVSSLMLNSNSFEFIKRNLERKMVDVLPASLKWLRLDVDRAEAGDLITMLQNCDGNLHEFQLTISMLYNLKGLDWIPKSVKVLRFHDSSRCHVPRVCNNIVNTTVEELTIVAASGFNIVGIKFNNVKSLTLLDSVLDKQLARSHLECEAYLSAALRRCLGDCKTIENIEYGHGMEYFTKYLPTSVLQSVQNLRYSWYYSTDSKGHIISALESCPNLKSIKTKYEPEIDALAFATLLWIFISSTKEFCEIILNTSCLTNSCIFLNCTIPTSIGYILDRREFSKQFASVRVTNLEKTVHY